MFRGILCSDRFSAYLKYHSGKAQFCWAHLKRNLLGIVEFTKSCAVERFGRDTLAQHARLFTFWEHEGENPLTTAWNAKKPANVVSEGSRQ